MTTLRQVITRAAELVAESSEGLPAPTAYFANTLAIPRFNGMVRALFGRLIGPDLTSTRPTASTDVRSGARYFVGASALTLTLPTEALDGTYFGLADTHAALSVNPVTLARNGWLLEGDASDLTLADNGAALEWFFRADTGNWERVRDLGLDDEVYFPADIVHGLASMLAAELLPTGYASSEVLALQANAARQRIAQRYAPRFDALTDPGLRSCGWAFDITRG